MISDEAGEVTPRTRVLVVEDSFLTAETLAFMLAELGFEVVGPVPTVRAALQLIQEEHVDIALLDVNLRGQFVTPVAARLQELGRPVLFLTAYGNLELLPPDLRDYPRIVKPFTHDVLAAALARVLDAVPFPRGAES